MVGGTETVHTLSTSVREGFTKHRLSDSASETDTTAGSVNWSDVTVVTSSVKAGTGNCCRIVAVPCGTKLNLVALSQHRNRHCRQLRSLKINDCKLVERQYLDRQLRYEHLSNINT